MKLYSSHEVNLILSRLVYTSNEVGDFTGISRHIGQIVLEAFSPDACIIRSYNPLTGTLLETPLMIGDPDLQSAWSCDELKQDMLNWQTLKDGFLSIDDLDQHPEYHNRFTRQAGIHGLTVLALFTLSRHKPLGMISLLFRQPHSFGELERENLHLFSVQASILLQETWSAYFYNRTAMLGQEVNQHLATVEDLFETLQTYVEAVLDHRHTLFLAIHQPQLDTLDIYIREQKKTFRIRSQQQGACQYVLQTQEALLIGCASELGEDLPYHLVSLENTLPRESYVFVPLVLRGVSQGVLSIQHGEADIYGAEDLLIFKLLANYVALALHNMRLYNSLDYLNQTGQLLTRQVESANTVQETVERIQQATQADVVVLYPYDTLHRRFILPPRFAGQLLDPAPYSLYPSRPDDLTALMLHYPDPIFAKEGGDLYRELLSDRPPRPGNFREREQIRSSAAIPLRVGEEMAGVLFVNFRQAQRFDATQKLFIEGLALFAAIAIKNAQVYGSLSERRLRELAILQHIDRELDRNLDLNSVLQTLLNMAVEHIEGDEGAILLYDEQARTLLTHTAIGQSAEKRWKQHFSLKDTKGIVRWVLEHKKPVRVENVLTDSHWRGLYLQIAAETRSELDIPLLDGEKIIGVLNVESKRERAFSEQDQHFLLTLAGQALLAIKKAQTYELEKRLSEERRVLNEISKEITSHLDYEHVFNLLLEKALSLTGATFGSLHLYNASHQTLRLVAEQGTTERFTTESPQSLSVGIVGYAAQTKTWYNISDVTDPAWSAVYLEYFPQVRSELVGPMLSGEELRGVLNIESPEYNHFDEGHMRLMQELANLAVIAWQNAERYNEATREAQRFELLYQAAQELSKITDLDQIEKAYDIVLHSAITQNQDREQQSWAIIRRYNEESAELEIVRVSQDYPALHKRTDLYTGINGQVARELRTIVVDNILEPQAGTATPQPSDPSTNSLLVTPIKFEEYYYGNLALNSRKVGYFQQADQHFFEGLAQQLANTIHRLEMMRARQESEQRAHEAEAMSDIGHLAFELTHRWDNDLGLVRSYINNIQSELQSLGVESDSIALNLARIIRVTRSVLDLSKNLKQSVTTDALSLQAHAGKDELISIYPEELFDIVLQHVLIPDTIQVQKEINDKTSIVSVFQNSVVDLLRNLITNALDAMPDGGTITLRSNTIGNMVALEVIDTGIGIAPQQQRRSFDLFYSTKGSSGFGLWSARKHAIKNRGELRLTSEIGQGTTLTLLLPAGEGSFFEGSY